MSHYDLQALRHAPAPVQVKAMDRYRLTIDHAFGPGMADALDRFATVLASHPEALTRRCRRTRPVGGREHVPERIVQGYKEAASHV